MRYETVLMTFYEKSDEQIAYESLKEANDELKAFQSGGTFDEKELRILMQKLLDAFWVYRAYDIDIAKDIVFNIHSLGRMIVNKYGCQYEFDQDSKSYYTACPAILLHFDFGFSIRAVEKYKCSICGRPVLDCEHLSGDFYNDVLCRHEGDICNICGRTHCSDHIIGQRYNNVRSFHIPYDIKLITFDIVKDPEMKYARVTKAFYSEDEVRELLPEDEQKGFVYGESVLYCSHCLYCDGFNPKLFDPFFCGE